MWQIHPSVVLDSENGRMVDNNEFLMTDFGWEEKDKNKNRVEICMGVPLLSEGGYGAVEDYKIPINEKGDWKWAQKEQLPDELRLYIHIDTYSKIAVEVKRIKSLRTSERCTFFFPDVFDTPWKYTEWTVKEWPLTNNSSLSSKIFGPLPRKYRMITVEEKVWEIIFQRIKTVCDAVIAKRASGKLR